MLLVVSDKNSPEYNLALEEWLIRNADLSETYLYFYVNNPTVVLGKNQNVWEEVNIPYVMENNVKVVRRISGGGAVYHDTGNLNFSFIQKHDLKRFNKYDKFTEPVLKALRRLSVPAELNERNDIVILGKKVSGNAQFSSRGVMCSHGTLLVNSQLERLRASLKVNAEGITSRSSKSVRSSVSNIADFMEVELDVNTVRKFITEEIDKAFGITEVKITDEMLKGVDELIEEKYSRQDWNFGRSPEFTLERASDNMKVNLSVKEGKILTADIVYKNHKLIPLNELLTGIWLFPNEIKNRLTNTIIDTSITRELLGVLFP